MLPQLSIILLLPLKVFNPFVCFVPLGLVQQPYNVQFCHAGWQNVFFCFKFPLDHRVCVLPVNLTVNLEITGVVSSAVRYQLTVFENLRVELVQSVGTWRLAFFEERSDFTWLSDRLEVINLPFQAIFRVKDFELAHKPERLLRSDCSVHFTVN